MTPQYETNAAAEDPNPAVRKLSAQFRALEERFKGRSVRLAELFAATQSRGYYLLMILFCLPFLTPVPTLMLSTLFGAAIFLTALRLALGKEPWLPRRVLEKELPSGFLSRLVPAASRLLKWIEALLRPRLSFMHNTRLMDRLGAGAITFSALLLMLPLPVPFSNFFPAGAILLLSAGALERDGLCSLAGWAMGVAATAFTAGIAVGGLAIFDGVGRWLQN